MLDFSARASPSLRNPTSFCYKSLLFCELLQVAIAICEEKKFVKKEGRHQKLYGGTFKLTEEGMNAAEYVRSKAALAVEIAGKDMDSQERATLYKALESIVENLRVLSKEGIPET